jgi:hypothetical protein
MGVKGGGNAVTTRLDMGVKAPAWARLLSTRLLLLPQGPFGRCRGPRAMAAELAGRQSTK